MLLLNRTIWCISSLTVFLIIYSCSNNPVKDDSRVIKSALTVEEQADLVKIANTITSLIATSSTDGLTKSKMTEEIDGPTNGCDLGTLGLMICHFQYSEYIIDDTAWYWADAAKTIPYDIANPPQPVGDHYFLKHIIVQNSNKVLNLLIDCFIEKLDSLPNTGENDTVYHDNTKSTMKYEGTINYYNDDLILEFYDTEIGYNRNSIFGDYRFKIMDDKYRVHLNFTEQKEPPFKGPIVNNKNEQIGTFILYGDDRVEILDNEGNSVKTAG